MARTKEARNAWLRDWCKRNPEKRFMRYLRARLKKKYGMTPLQYRVMLLAQGGRCQLCRVVLKVPSPWSRVVRDGDCAVIDHVHGQDEDKLRWVRGILCNNCNRALGLFKDSPEVLRKAATYVETRKQAPFFIPWRKAQDLVHEPA